MRCLIRDWGRRRDGPLEGWRLGASEQSLALTREPPRRRALETDQTPDER
jgi:hypothetical protein